MKILKTANYKKAMEEISYQELFDNSLRKNDGDERKAAEFILDLATSGTWAVWDQEKIDNGISKILDQFGSQATEEQPFEEQVAEDQANIDAERYNEEALENRSVLGPHDKPEEFKDSRRTDQRSEWTDEDTEEYQNDKWKDEYSGRAGERREQKLDDKFDTLWKKHKEHSSVKVIRTANYENLQIDIVECMICGKSKGRDQMANSDVCHDCKDREDYENS
jgi:hypothetical protein